jgi:hypothetical protein
MALNAPYWGGTGQKFVFKTTSGQSITCQTNPTAYALDPGDNMFSGNPSSNATLALPAVMGPSILLGPMEYAPSGIALEWAEMSYTQYTALATTFNLVQGYMIDQDDHGYAGYLKLMSYDYGIGVAQKVGHVKAVFFCTGPANGQTSTINTLPTPSTITPTLSVGGSIPNANTTYYTYTWWSPWGEGLQSPIFSSTSTASNQAATINFTFPVSNYFRRARLYAASTSAGLAAGSTAFVMADVWVAMSPQWIDTTGINGLTNTAVIPLVNTAATGLWSGGIWINGS